MSNTPPSLSRRQTIAWMAAATAATGTPFVLAGPARSQTAMTPWPKLTLPKVETPGYGTDPDLSAKTVTWPLLLSEGERAKLRIAADIILPPASGQKAPSEMGIDAFISEWVSAPYARQVADRALIVPGLVWLDTDARSRFGRDFAAASDAERRAIFDTIAYPDKLAERDKQAGDFFACLRQLNILAYYTTPQGMEEIGFAGNTVIVGLYPGPSPEALEHLAGELAELGLKMPG
jgi:hypothetical protein